MNACQASWCVSKPIRGNCGCSPVPLALGSVPHLIVLPAYVSSTTGRKVSPIHFDDLILPPLISSLHLIGHPLLDSSRSSLSLDSKYPPPQRGLLPPLPSKSPRRQIRVEFVIDST